MKTLLIASAVAATIALTPTAQAGHKWKHRSTSFYDYAKVVQVEPITRTVRISTPRRECWEEEVRTPVVETRGNTAGGTILGGMIGGVIANRLGRHSSGRTNATIAGTLIGSAIGNDIAHRRTQTVQYDRIDMVNRCTVSHEYTTEERIEGYDVTYRYREELLTARMPYDPGKRIRIRVGVSPVYND